MSLAVRVEKVADEASERVWLREDGVMVYRELPEMSIASIDAMMSRAQALAPELPSSPLCLVDLRELRRRPSAAQVRRLISGIRAANVRFEHLAFVIGSRTLAVAARFVARPLHGGRFSVHCELASAEAALCRARDRGQS